MYEREKILLRRRWLKTLWRVLALRERKSKEQQAGSGKAAEKQKAAGRADKRAKATVKKRQAAIMALVISEHLTILPPFLYFQFFVNQNRF